MVSRTCFAAVVCLTVVTAQGFTFSGIDRWVGEGANEAALVVDFNDAIRPNSLAWGYRFDGSPTGWDMFSDVLAADSNMYATIDSATSRGPALFGIGYDVDGDGFAISDGSAFDTDGVSDLNVWDPNTDNTDSEGTSLVDDAIATNSDDHYREGWFSNGFWVHFESSNNPYEAGSWSSGLGLGSQSLSDGAWTGLSFDGAFSFSDSPSQPLPEPAALGLFVLGGVALVARRR